MSNNYNIGAGRADDSDLRFSHKDNMPDQTSATDRQQKARQFARQIAMNIGSDDRDEYYDNYERPAEPLLRGNEATKERNMPSRSVESTQRSGQSRSSAQRSTASRGSQTRSSGGQRRAPQQQSRSASSQPRRSNGGGRPPQQRKRRKKKSSGGGAVIAFLLGFVVLVIGIGYFVGLILTNGAFLPNTTINGVDVSKMTLAEATQVLETTTDEMNIEITKRDGTVILIPYSSFDYGDNIAQLVQQTYSGINRKLWFKSLFSSTDYVVKPETSYDQNKLIQELDSIVWGTTEPQNAFITRTDSGFEIVDATNGDKVKYDVLKPYLLDQISKGNMKINISDVDCYYTAEIQREDLEDKLQFYERVGNINIKIDFDYTQEELTIDDFGTWLTFDENGNYTVNKDEVAQYVGYLADTYDTYGKARKFHATIQGDIYVDQGPQGTYGWLIDQEKTTEKLTQMLEEGTSGTIDPIYATRLDKYGNVFFTYKSIESARSAESDIGDTYIEVDLTNQTIWYYYKGELKFETDQVVSGLASNPKRKTPEGVYEILDKKSPYYMNGDGYSDVYCKYFIRVSYEGIGFHDLSRSSYGGEIYLTNGSHGCLNMKKAEVEKLYNLVQGGTPVIMYY